MRRICILIFSKVGLVDHASKPCTQIYLQKIANYINLQLAIRISKSHTFRTCTTPLMDIQADFEINRPIRYLIAAKRNYFHRRQTETDRRTDGQTLRTTTIGSFFFEERKNH